MLPRTLTTMSALFLGLAAISLHAVSVASALNVATLSQHNPTSWSKDSGCRQRSNAPAAANDAGDLALIHCNLRVYAEAVKLAANTTAATADGNGVDLVLFPEGYALAGDADVRSRCRFCYPLLDPIQCIHSIRPCAVCVCVRRVCCLLYTSPSPRDRG